MIVGMLRHIARGSGKRWWLAQVLVGGLSAGLGVACARSGASKSALAETVVAQSDHAGAPAPDCREREQARALSDAGDTLVKRDVTRAIDSYTRAIRVYPKDHRLFLKLALALLRQEDWRRAEVALTRAVELGPSFANYWFQLGNVLVMQAEEGDASAFERAKVPLKRCIEVDPNIGGRSAHGATDVLVHSRLGARARARNPAGCPQAETSRTELRWEPQPHVEIGSWRAPEAVSRSGRQHGAEANFVLHHARERLIGLLEREGFGTRAYAGEGAEFRGVFRVDGAAAGPTLNALAR